ncbi:SRPBCC family protein [Pseudonocardia sp. WMMC193]|uniref:SRPBCC family protein n=1 Tax=Pseudonocardia sp. WMMC193 TaxID=2911965 RepID=UPI001F170364|nr:SRPBCC family protein [Pseudonocardia sp. WMMC193]MCF7548791.1 SRPBCC family protein [Pseudonocardia sp. WMMC193]
MEWTGARYADGPTVQVETWVDAPPERVWPAVVDVTAMPDQSPEIVHVEWLDGGPEVGSRFRGRSSHASLGEWETVSHVVECEEPRVFAWAVADPDEPTATWRFTLDTVDGGTRLRQSVRMGPAPSGLSLAIEAMPDKEQKIVFVRLREFERNMTGTVEAIKKRVEGA